MWNMLCARAKDDLSPTQFNVFDTVLFKPGTATSATAGAGAGKTRTLSFLVAKALIDDSVDSVSILTATRTAKNEAIARVAALFDSSGLATAGARPIDAFNVRTIHSVALQHVRRKAEADPDLAGVEVVSKTHLMDLLREGLLDAYPLAQDSEDILTPEKMPADEAAEFLLKVRTERLNGCKPVVDDSLGSIARHAFSKLDEHMACSDAGMRLTDYASMVEALRADDVGLCTPGGVLFVDEAQDLTQCQLEIVLNTVRRGACVVVLGDDSQGIFVFGGACNRTIHEFEQRCTQLDVPLTRHHLFTNFRSTNQIVRVSEQLLPHVDRMHRVGVTGNGVDGAAVEVLVTNNDYAQALASRILDVALEGYGPGGVVVLRHKNWHNGDPIVIALRTAVSKSGVDVPIAVGGASGSETLKGRFLAVMQATGDGHLEDDEVVSFLKALKCTRGCPPLSARAVCHVLREHPVHDTLGVFQTRKKELMETFKQLEESQGAKAANTGPPKKKSKMGVSQKLQNFELLVNVAIRAVSGIRKLVQAVEWDKPVQRVRLDNGLASFTLAGALPNDELTAVGKLVQCVLRDVVHSPLRATDSEDVGELVNTFNLDIDITDTVVDAIAAPLAQLHACVHDKETKGKVVFSTIHKFKGLERPVAFVVQLKEPWATTSWAQRAALSTQHEPTCPNRSGQEDACCGRFGLAVEKVEDAMKAEKRRLYYVAASRAQERLFLHTLASRPGEPLGAVVAMAKGKVGGWVKV